jgi:dGTPase
MIHPNSPLRTKFQIDRDRITHSKSFRRLMHKTQVFISPEGDHYRTRLTHTLEVAQISRTVARALGLDEDLTEAIALGHDLGHTPFGHTGEDALDTILPDGFAHNVQSVRVVEVLEDLRLSPEVVDGILNHRTHLQPATQEGQIVQICDKIAYMNHDVDDAIRAGIVAPSDLPADTREMLGATPSARIDFLVRDLVFNSANKPKVSLSAPVSAVLQNLRTYLFETVYETQINTTERAKIHTMFALMHEHYTENPTALPPGHTAADYIAGMTDRFAQKNFRDLFMPASFAI